MKNILLLLTLFINTSVFAQLPPANLPDGLTSPFIRLYELTTLQRDALTPVEGDFIYNTDIKSNQYYNGATWISYQKEIKSYTTVQRDALTPDNFDVIYNSTDTVLQYWDGDSWEALGGVDQTADYTWYGIHNFSATAVFNGGIWVGNQNVSGLGLDPYNINWDSSTKAVTQNDVYDKIESLEGFIPPFGITGQVLVKSDNFNYNVEWQDPVNLSGLPTLAGSNTFSNPVNYFGNPAANHIRMFGGVPSIETWLASGAWSALRPDMLIFNNATSSRSIFLKPPATITDNYEVFLQNKPGIVSYLGDNLSLFNNDLNFLTSADLSTYATLGGDNTFTGTNNTFSYGSGYFNFNGTATGATGVRFQRNGTGVLLIGSNASNQAVINGIGTGGIFIDGQSGGLTLNAAISNNDPSSILSLGDAAFLTKELGDDLYQSIGVDGSETKINAGTNVTVTGAGTTGSPYVINSTASGGGSGNPYQVVVTNETELIAVGTLAKEVLITQNFDLTANRSLQQDTHITYAGGTINLAGFELNGVDNNWSAPNDKVLFDTSNGGVFTGTWKAPCEFTIKNFGGKENNGVTRYLAEFDITVGTNTVVANQSIFTADIVGQYISIVGAGGSGYAHHSLVTGYTNATTITIADNAVATVTDANGAFGYDNKNVLWQAFYVFNQNKGTVLNGQSNSYYTTTNLRTTLNANAPSNLWVKSDDLTLENIKFYQFPHDLATSALIVLEDNKNTTFKNVVVHGDTDLHSSSTAGKTEGNDGIVFRSQCDNVQFFNVSVFHFFTDGAYGTGSQQFSNYIDGANNVTGSTHTQIAVGSVSESDGTTIDSGDTTKFHTQTLIDLDTAAFDKQLSNGDTQRHYKVGGRSFAGWSGLKTTRYKAFYFAEDQTTLLYVSPVQFIYDEVVLDDAFKWVRLEFEEAESLADVQLMLAPHLRGKGLYWQGGEIAFNLRDGFSNSQDNSVLNGIDFHDNGGWGPGPGADINDEDIRRNNRNKTVINCTFRNSWINISIIGAENVYIGNNTLLPNTKDLSAAPTQSFHTGISVPLGYNVRIVGNTSYDRENTFGKGCNLTGNRWIGGLFTAMANGGQSLGDDFVNVYFKGGANSDSGNSVGYPFLITKAEIHYNMQLGTRYLINDPEHKLAFDDNRWRFNSIRDLNATTTSYEHIFFGENSENRLFIGTNPTNHYGGYFKRNHFFGAKPLVSARDVNSGNAYFPLEGFNDNVIETSIEFNQDLLKSYVSKNNTIKGFLRFNLEKFPNSVSGTAEVIRLENYEVIIDNSYNWTNSNSQTLITPTKYVNFEFIDLKIDLQQTSSQTGASMRFVDLNHKGTSYFYKPKFLSASAKTWDLTNTFIFPADLGAVTMIDPYAPNFTFTLRAIDEIVYTDKTLVKPITSAYTTILDDRNDTYLRVENVDVTIAPDATYSTNIGDTYKVRNASGTVNLVAGSGVTINGTTSITLNTTATLIKVGADEWDVIN